MLAAGESSRFNGRLKQFIHFKHDADSLDKQMFENAIESLTLPARCWVALRNDAVGAVAACHRAFTPVPVLHTRGQAQTLLWALQALPEQSELLVVNCDAGWAPHVLDCFVEESRKDKVASAIVFSIADLKFNDPSRYSHIDSYPGFYMAAEKRAISRYALAGAYYFPNIPELSRALRTACLNTRFEPYISHAYNHIHGKKNTFLIEQDQWFDWGTPEALAKYLSQQ